MSLTQIGRDYILNMRRNFLYVSGILSGLVFMSGYLYLAHKTSSTRTHTVLKMLVWNHTNIDQRHKCFNLFSSSRYFRSIVESKNRLCRVVTHGEWNGRVGNQMFQVAAVVGIAHDLDMIPVINVKELEIAKYFSFSNTFNTDSSNVARCKEKGSAVYSNCSDIHQNTTLQNIMVDGFRQSWKYFTNATAYIRKMFQFKAYYITKARKFIKTKTILGHDNVCLHVRRGDFLTPEEQSVGRTVAGTNFLSKAMQFYQRKFTKVRFIVLSDDIAWCQHNLKGNVTFSPYTDPGVDLAIISLCDHVIVTSGTFGWWGAWLSNGTVGYFHGYPRKGSAFYKRFNSDDYYPPNWIKL